MLAVPRRQSLALLVLVLTIVAAAWWIGRPASEAAAPHPTRSALPPTAPTSKIDLAIGSGLSLPISAFSYGLSRSISTTGTPGPINNNDVSVSLPAANLDPRLLEAITSGQVISEVRVTLAEKTGHREWLLNGVLLSSAQWGHETKAGTVSITLDFGKMTLLTFDKKGQLVADTCLTRRSGFACIDS